MARSKGWLREPSDKRSLEFIAFYYSLILVAFLFPQISLNYWFGVPLFILTCTWSWLCAVIAHNTIHTAVFTTRKVNNYFQVVLSCAYGGPICSFISGHNMSHHRYVQKDRDVMRTTKLRYRWNLLNLLLFFPTIAPKLLRDDLAYAMLMKKKNPVWYTQWKREQFSILAITAALLCIDWQRAVMYWIVPHLCATYGIVTINYLQHDGCDEDSEYNHARNFTGYIWGYFTFNNGFHTAHHNEPTVHWSKLRDLHEKTVKPYIDPALDEPSMLLYSWRAVVWPGKRVDYKGNPVTLPEDTPDRPWFNTSTGHVDS